MIDKRIVNALLIVDIGVVFFCYLAGTRVWLINSQIGFVSAFLVVFASTYSYSKMVQTQVANAKPLKDEDDTLEKIDDPHGVFTEDDAGSQEEESKEEPKISVLESLKNSRASVSLFRIGAYAIFAIGFMYLTTNKLLHLPSYFVGITLPIVIIIALLLLRARKGSL